MNIARCMAYLLTLTCWTPAFADEAIFTFATPVSDAELGSQRGGFTVGGLDISLGAEIRTFVDGQLALMTTINWDANQASSVTQQFGGAVIPASAAELQNNILRIGDINLRVGDASGVYLANAGQTAIVQQTQSGIQNILVNTASNTAIQTQIDARFDVANYAAFQGSIQPAQVGQLLGGVLNAATVGAIGR